MTYTHVGRYPGYKDMRTRNKGIMAAIRRQKRAEAEARNDLTPLYKTARFNRQSDEVKLQWLEEAGLVNEYWAYLQAKFEGKNV